MSPLVDIPLWALAAGYGLLIFPLGLMLWYGIDLIGATALAVVRMTVQLLFVGFYLQFLFDLNHAALNAAWLLIMVGVADLSIGRRCGLRLRRFFLPLAGALLAGTFIPLVVFVGILLQRPSLLDAQYAIPVGGMILGNCLRADIIGLGNFYEGIRKSEKAYLHALAQGARLAEATRPFARDACRAALLPTIATMSTVGLVILPGMMTGVILGGADPMVAIKYQVAIMIAIFSGTALTVALAILLTTRSCFTPYGILDRDIFRPRKKKGGGKGISPPGRSGPRPGRR